MAAGLAGSALVHESVQKDRRAAVLSQATV